MKFAVDTAEIFVPDGISLDKALARTTHMAIAAHQDDIEIMSSGGVLACFQQADKWFTGVTVTNGSGSPRDWVYKEYTDDVMQIVRKKEQKKAAVVGEYAAQVLLDFTSSAVKDAQNGSVAGDLYQILMAARPETVFTHNLADKHDTHVAVTLRLIEAIRRMPAEARPRHLYGGEVWRDLDWMSDADKVAFDLSGHENIQAALLGVFDSQIAGGKRYDLASMGRRKAHATYHASHGTDATTGLNFAMDLTPLITDQTNDIPGFLRQFIDRFAEEVLARVRKAGGDK
jgi:LmbE family N-acetylglucosaminyl deacetylase